MAKICIMANVSGVVQGVGFRYFTQREAQKLGLTGSVFNLNNGEVEVLACGEEEQVNQLLVWLQNGPRAARVDEVIHRRVEMRPMSGFIAG